MIRSFFCKKCCCCRVNITVAHIVEQDDIQVIIQVFLIQHDCLVSSERESVH